MKKYRYLIIGGGMTAAAAVNGIRETDSEGTIGIISSETDAPYKRPPLSKSLWKGEPINTIWKDLTNTAVELNLGLTAREIDPAQKQVICSNDAAFNFDKLLLATGVKPRQFSFGDNSILYFRTLADYRKLRALAEYKERFIVIGGGFIGTEIAAALSMNGKKVTMFFPGKGPGDNIFPPDLSQYINTYYKEKGIDVHSQEKIVNLRNKGSEYVVDTGRQMEFTADGVIAGIGTLPNIELAKTAKINTDNGILVDEFLQTDREDIYSAGDVASFYSQPLKKNIRVEHEDNANTMGMAAGRNMAGKIAPYRHLPFFYSDMFELGYEAVGELDSSLEMFSDWKQQFKEGVIYYMNKDRVRGVLLWNVWGKVDEARALIADPGPFKTGDLKGRL